MDTKLTTAKTVVTFAAIDKSLETTIPSFEESEMRGKKYISYGEGNQMPEYLYGLYLSVSTLKTIIDGTSNFVAGDDVYCNIDGFRFEVNRKGDTARELVELLARDYLIYGGYALQVVRDKKGDIAELYYIDFRYLRSSKKNDLFWYSEEYDKKYSRSDKTIVYPKFVAEAKDVPTSIIYVKNDRSHTYPIPRYSGAIKACEIERNIDEYHLSALENGFGGSYIINFLNGIPEDEEKAEIERNVNEKWAGASNAGRIMLNFANGKENATTVEKLDVTDFSEKYKAAATRSREQIYCAFQAVPSIFGLMTESKGFSQEEFEQAFRLFNRTVVRGIQTTIVDTFDKIFQTKGSMTIKPFSIEEENNTEEVVE